MIPAIIPELKIPPTFSRGSSKRIVNPISFELLTIRNSLKNYLMSFQMMIFKKVDSKHC